MADKPRSSQAPARDCDKPAASESASDGLSGFIEAPERIEYMVRSEDPVSIEVPPP